MSLNLTIADQRDSELRWHGKIKSRRQAAVLLALIVLLLIAATFGVVYPDPITTPPW